MPHISIYSQTDLVEVMKYAKDPLSWKDLLDFLSDNEAYKGHLQDTAVPGLIDEIRILRDRGEPFTKDPHEIMEKINNSRPVKKAGKENHAPLRGRELEDTVTNTDLDAKPARHREPKQF